METRGVRRKAASRAFFSTLPGLRARRDGMVNIHQLLSWLLMQAKQMEGRSVGGSMGGGTK